MSFTRPTLSQLVTRLQADFISKFELTSALLRVSVTRIYARVFAGASHMMHAHLEFLGEQLFPDKSEDEFLVRQAGLFGLSKNAPAYARATVSFTGTNGSIVVAGSVLTDADGHEFETDEEVTISGGVAAVSITALVAGADSSLEASDLMSLQSPIAGVDSTAEVTEVLVDGTDQEDTESLRTRLLERMADPPMGGTDADYVAWAKLIAGVTRAWVYPQGLGPGTVLVRFVRDDDGAGSAIIPDAGEISDVQDKLDELRPAHASVTVVAPTYFADEFDISISPDTSAMRDAVAAQLVDLYHRESEPGATILLSAIRTAIGSTPGIVDYTLSSPTADATHTESQLPAVDPEAIIWS